MKSTAIFLIVMWFLCLPISGWLGYMAINGGFSMTPMSPLLPNLGSECVAIIVLFNASFPAVYLVSKMIYEKRRRNGS